VDSIEAEAGQGSCGPVVGVEEVDRERSEKIEFALRGKN
jgi:hypothetical protein